MAVAAVPRRGRPSQQDTVAMPAVPHEDEELALAHTIMPGAKTQIATDAAPRRGGKKTMITTPVARVRSNDSSLEIPIDAVLVDDELPRVRRQITLGDGMLERVPPRRMWILHAAVIVASLSIAVVALAAN
jgi:hypothetical protein